MVSYNPFLYVLILVVMMLAVAWLGTVVYLALRRYWKWSLGLALAGLAAPAWAIVMIFHPFGPVDALRILDREELADGTELALSQARNPEWTQPYSIQLWVKPPEKPWGCIHIDHESRWWRRGRIDVRGDWITLVRGRDEVFCGFTRQGNEFRVDDEDEPMAPFEVDAGWEPRDGVDYQAALLEAALKHEAAETPDEQETPQEHQTRETGSSHGRE